MMYFLFGWLACLTLFVIWRLQPHEPTIITPEKQNLPTWPQKKLNVEFLETDRVQEIFNGKKDSDFNDLLS